MFRGTRALVAGAAIWSMAPLALANSASYTKTHFFNLQLRGNEIYRVAWSWHVRAQATGQTQFDQDTDFGAAPYGQAPANDFKIALASADGALAVSTADFSAAANGSGFHRLTGLTDVTKGVGRSAIAVGVSKLALNKGTIDGRGRITWKPDWIIDNLRSPGAERDPIDFRVFDFAAGRLYEERLFEVGVDFFDGGTASWQNGDISVEGRNGQFFVTVGSAHVTNLHGQAFITFENGVITGSVQTGVFAGLFPGVGAPSTFGTHFGDAQGNIDIDFDFGPETQAGYDFTAEFAAAAQIQVVPEPASMAALSLGLLCLVRRHAKDKGEA